MINIEKFEVNKIILLISTLRKSYLNQIDFINQERFKPLLDVVKNFTNHPEGYKKILEDDKLMELIENEVLNNPQFTDAFVGAEKYKKYIEHNWNKHKPIVEDYYENVLGLSQDLNVAVNIVNPRWPTGTNDMHNEIFFGAVDSKSPEDETYGTTYIMHEAFHCCFPYDKNWSNEQICICHSLIELAIDNELRKRLGNNSFEYGTQGHADARKSKKKIITIME